MQQQQRVVVALGGNAFVAPQQRLTMAGQFEFARQALAQLRPLLELEFQVLITHGNGPQVGFELIRVEAALGQAYAVPLDVCVAESEGELGYVLTQSLHEVLARFGRPRPIASLLTQVVVDASDPAFAEPTMPIGGFYSEAQADELRRLMHEGHFATGSMPAQNRSRGAIRRPARASRDRDEPRGATASSRRFGRHDRRSGTPLKKSRAR